MPTPNQNAKSVENYIRWRIMVSSATSMAKWYMLKKNVGKITLKVK
jgi:hypothetical protein